MLFADVDSESTEFCACRLRSHDSRRHTQRSRRISSRSPTSWTVRHGAELTAPGLRLWLTTWQRPPSGDAQPGSTEGRSRAVPASAVPNDRARRRALPSTLARPWSRRSWRRREGKDEPLADQRGRARAARPAAPRAQRGPRPAAQLPARGRDGGSSAGWDPRSSTSSRSRKGRRSYLTVAWPFGRSRGSVGSASSSRHARPSPSPSTDPGANVARYTDAATCPGRAASPSQTSCRSSSRYPSGIDDASASRTRHTGSRSISHTSASSASPGIATPSGAAMANRGRDGTASMPATGSPDAASARSHAASCSRWPLSPSSGPRASRSRQR